MEVIVTTRMRSSWFTRVTAVALGALLSVAALGRDGAAEDVKIGASGPRTGPNSGAWVAYQATRACILDANDKGGVNGYKFNHILLDDQYDPQVTLGATRRLVDQENVLALVGHSGTAGTLAIKDYILSKGVPDVGLHSGSAAVNSAVTYPISPSSASQGAFQAKYLIDKGLTGGGLGVLYENDDVGKAVLSAVESIAKQNNVKLTLVPFQLGSRDKTAQVATLKEAGVTAVIISGIPSEFPTSILAAVNVDYHPTWFAVAYAAEPRVMSQLPSDQVKNMYFSWYTAFPGDPGTQDLLSAMKKYYPDVTPPTPTWSEGWASCTVFLEAFKRATQGGKPPTRQSIISALNTFKDYSNSYISGITYTADSHLLTLRQLVGQWDATSNTLKRVTPFTAPPTLGP